MTLQANRLEFLKSIRKDIHGKLKPLRTQLKELDISEEESSQIIDDFNTLDSILEALEEQHIRIVLVGKVNAGKSSLANSLLQADVYKTDAIQGTAIKANGSIKLGNWEIHDTPGIMHNLADDEEAKEKIRRSHVKILVIDDQPYEPELELFQWATELMPGLPTVVFFNKYDKFKNQPRADRERILEKIKLKMKPFVKNIETDIIFGSASLFDVASDSYKRQVPPKNLLNWLYNQADYSSTLIKVIDPAKQALTNIESNVLEAREKVARRVVIEYAEGNALAALIPFSSVTFFPARLHNLNLTICAIMGVPPEKIESAESITKVFWQGVWSAVKVEALWSVVGAALSPFTFGVSLAATLWGTYSEWNESQKRVLVLGEALIEWIKSGYPDITDSKAYLDQIRKKVEAFPTREDVSLEKVKKVKTTVEKPSQNSSALEQKNPYLDKHSSSNSKPKQVQSFESSQPGYHIFYEEDDHNKYADYEEYDYDECAYCEEDYEQSYYKKYDEYDTSMDYGYLDDIGSIDQHLYNVGDD